MKELNSHNSKEEIEIRVQTEQEKQRVLVDEFIIHPGQSCWEFNLVTRDLQKAEIKTEFVTLNSSVKKEVTKKDKCLYVVALNKENAAKKINKMLDFARALTLKTQN